MGGQPHYQATSHRDAVKLLHVAASYFPATRYGGTIVSVHALCRALAQRGHDVHVYTTSVDGASNLAVPHGTPVDVDGVTVWYFESTMFRRIYRAPALGAALRVHVGEFDVVHTHAIYLWPLWTAAREAKRAGVPYVVSPRGMLEKELIERKSALLKIPLIGFFEKRTLEEAAAIHFTSQREAQEATAFGFHFRRVREIPNGVDAVVTEGGAASPAVDAIIRGDAYVLFLGRVNWKKGLDRLVAAMPFVPALRLVIAGNDEERYTTTLKELAQNYGVANRIVFSGPVYGADKATLLRHTRALVLPSYSENFGNVVLEAMSAGRPVIVTPEVGAATLVERSGAGVVVSGDPSALGAALTSVLSDEGAANAMGQRGRVVARAHSWDAVAADMERLYQEVR